VARLISYAADHDANDLRRLGRRIVEVVAPEVGEAHEARLLEREERDAEAAATFRMVEDGHGRCHGRFTLPSLHGAMFKKALLAIAAPRHRTAVDGRAPVPGRPSAQKLGQALMEYLETYPAEKLPHSGGVSATVVVTMPLETLIGGLAATQLDTGHRVSPAWPAGWPVRPGSSPRCSARSRRSSTWAAGSGSTPPPSASRWRSSRAAVPPRAVTGPPEGVTPTTTPRSARAAPPR
jgi:hypothetical protein